MALMLVLAEVKLPKNGTKVEMEEVVEGHAIMILEDSLVVVDLEDMDILEEAVEDMVLEEMVVHMEVVVVQDGEAILVEAEELMAVEEVFTD